MPTICVCFVESVTHASSVIYHDAIALLPAFFVLLAEHCVCFTGEGGDTTPDIFRTLQRIAKELLMSVSTRNYYRWNSCADYVFANPATAAHDRLCVLNRSTDTDSCVPSGSSSSALVDTVERLRSLWCCPELTMQLRTASLFFPRKHRPVSTT